MNTKTNIVRYTLIALVIVVLAALWGWYSFLRSRQNTTATQSAARGYGSVQPTFQGSGGSTFQNTMSTLGGAGTQTSASSSARMWHVSAVPIAGFGWSGGDVPRLYFAERATGYIFEATVPTRGLSRLTDTLRPQVYEAFFSGESLVVERSMDDSGNIMTFAGTFATSTASASSTASGNSSTSTSSSVRQLNGITLAANSSVMSEDAASHTLYYLLPSGNGSTLFSSDWKGANQKTLYTSSIRGWRIYPTGSGNVFLVQNAADNTSGYAYQLQKNGTLSLIAQGPGLTLSPKPGGGALLLGESSGGTLALFSQATLTSQPVSLSLATVAEKCAWLPGRSSLAYCGVPSQIPSQQFLNDWYKGIVHTSDSIWQVDASTASSSLLYNPQKDGASVDIEDPSIDPSGTYLAFIDASDQSLWVVKIVQ